MRVAGTATRTLTAGQFGRARCRVGLRPRVTTWAASSRRVSTARRTVSPRFRWKASTPRCAARNVTSPKGAARCTFPANSPARPATPTATAGSSPPAPHSNQCDQCHTPAGFLPPTFTVERHARTQFALTGRHVSVTCEKCHKPRCRRPRRRRRPGAPRPPGPPRQYRFASRNCAACHADPHRTTKACEDCHTTEQWQAPRPFDHSATKFQLEGAAPEGEVHPVPQALRAGRRSGRQGAGFRRDRHRVLGMPRGAKDAHAGQFRSGGPAEDCSSCHVTAAWDGKTFNHDKAQFILNRAHRDVVCAKCHKDQREVSGKLVRTYRGTPAECVKCH